MRIIPIVSNGAVFSYFLTVNSVFFSSLFFFPLSYNVFANFREVKYQLILCDLCGFVTSIRPAVKKGLS